MFAYLVKDYVGDVDWCDDYYERKCFRTESKEKLEEVMEVFAKFLMGELKIEDIKKAIG